jgi:hypothetical protein
VDVGESASEQHLAVALALGPLISAFLIWCLSCGSTGFQADIVSP